MTFRITQKLKLNLPIAFVIVLFASLQASAKKVYYVNFDEVEYEQWAWDFTIDSIIDARPVPELAGFVYKGLPKKKRLAKFRDPASSAIQKVLEGAEGFRQHEEKLILRINRLMVYETYGEGQHGVAELNVSFIRRTGSGYEELFQASRLFTDEGPFRFKYHPLNIIALMDSCFMDFSNRRTLGKLRPKPISKNELTGNPYYEQRPYPIEKNPPKVETLYRSFYDFRDNFGDTATIFYPEYFERERGFGRAELGFVDDSLNPSDFFAFSDGQKLYVRGGNKFYEMADSNSNYYLDSYAIDYGDYGGGMMVSGILFGPLGVALYAATNTPTRHKAGYLLDLDLGVVFPANINKLREVNGEIYIYNSDFNDSSQVASLSVNNTDNCLLPPDYYKRIEAPLDGSAVPVCVNFKDQEECAELSISYFHKAVYMVRFDRDGKMELKEVSSNVENSILMDIREGRATAICKN